MDKLDKQITYWDSVAATKSFSHPIREDIFRTLVSLDSNILDYGCGYGRTCAELKTLGYKNVIGVDISSEMIKRGLSLHQDLKLQQIDGDKLPFYDKTFYACTLFAVLTCIPTDSGQQNIIDELHRVLRHKGILYVNDFPLQTDIRYIERYNQFKDEYKLYGIFRLPDGGVVRHHDMNWIYKLLSQFEIIDEKTMEAITMNGNTADCFQIIARKR
jgi:SAM-dependent methyltransferase